MAAAGIPALTRPTQHPGLGRAFATVAVLFFCWGFVGANGDPLLTALRANFSLSFTQAFLTPLVSFLAFGLVSLPAGILVGRIGAVNAIVVGLAVMAVGALLVRATVGLGSFAPILAALFVMACGVTVLQVAANPLAALLGSAQGSHFRLNLAQSLNSLGMVAGSWFGAWLLLGSIQGAAAAPRGEGLAAIGQAYATIAVMLVPVLLLVATAHKGLRAAERGVLLTTDASMRQALASPWARFGAVAIGLYVGAEVSISGMMISFLGRPDVMALPLAQGGRYLGAFYWGGAMLGRIAGTALLTRIPAARLLLLCAGIAALLCMGVALGTGPLAGIAALAVGLFNSVMFPTIFSITLERSGAPPAATSGFLCLAIAGGGALPFAVGALADRAGLSAAFLVPALAYLVILGFAWRARGTA